MSLCAYLHVFDVPVGPEGDGVTQHRPGVVRAQTGPHKKRAHGVVHQPKGGLRQANCVQREGFLKFVLVF